MLMFVMLMALLFTTSGAWCGDHRGFIIPTAWIHHCSEERISHVFKPLNCPVGVDFLEVCCYGGCAINDTVAIYSRQQKIFCTVYEGGLGFTGSVFSIGFTPNSADNICYGNVLVADLSGTRAIIEFMEPSEGRRVQDVKVDMNDFSCRRGGDTRFVVTEQDLTVTKRLNAQGAMDKVFFVKACLTYADLSNVVMRWGERSCLGEETDWGHCTLDFKF